MNLCKRGLGLIHKSNLLHLRHPAEALVIDYEQHGRGQPRCGIAQGDGPVIQMRERYENSSASRSRHVPNSVRTVGMTLRPQPRIAEESTSTQQNVG